MPTSACQPPVRQSLKIARNWERGAVVAPVLRDALVPSILTLMVKSAQILQRSAASLVSSAQQPLSFLQLPAVYQAQAVSGNNDYEDDNGTNHGKLKNGEKLCSRFHL